FALNESLLLRGTVTQESDIPQITEIAEQYAPTILNHITVASSPREPFQVDPLAVPPTRKVPTTREGEVQKLRQDIQSLHQDVKRILDVLERQVDRKRAGNAVPRASAVLPPMDSSPPLTPVPGSNPFTPTKKSPPKLPRSTVVPDGSYYVPPQQQPNLSPPTYGPALPPTATDGNLLPTPDPSFEPNRATPLPNHSGPNPAFRLPNHSGPNPVRPVPEYSEPNQKGLVPAYPEPNSEGPVPEYSEPGVEEPILNYSEPKSKQPVPLETKPLSNNAPVETEHCLNLDYSSFVAVRTARIASPNAPSEQPQDETLGSGVVIESEPGQAIVLTAAHLLKDYKPGKFVLQVGARQESEVPPGTFRGFYSATVILRDDHADVALLRAKVPGKLNPISLAGHSLPGKQATVRCVGFVYSPEDSKKPSFVGLPRQVTRKVEDHNRYVGAENFELGGLIPLGFSGAAVLDEKDG
ncbi:MAG: trypsin-like peptidase domain-containing protein, partial [Planctomycetaceae bacterium]|nr:trypsin-like peptidase domain-containing protein [Planctomycetaceae bacterium]